MLARLPPALAAQIVIVASWPAPQQIEQWQSTEPLQRLRALTAAAAEWDGSVVTESGRGLQEKTCDAVSLRLLPPPSYTNYHECFNQKLEDNDNGTHDWSVPGAKIDAEIDCWCAHNLTETIEAYSCCGHRDLYPMCTIECVPDCASALAKECLSSCPSMCFEAAEYIVDDGLCKNCRWEKCWPVLKCLTEHAKHRVQQRELNRTCDETGFVGGQALQDYRKCWRHAPKHSSHWNVMASVLHCICREGMVQHTKDEHCCHSMLYGNGVCDLECLPEEECYSQAGQTCIHRCQVYCAAFDVAPGKQCLEECLETGSPCRKYASCATPHVTSHICDDGRWPSASSGCCEFNRSDGREGTMLGCPKLCEAQHVWRVDGGRAIPWWSRWQPGPGIIYQCTCEGCPQTTAEGITKMRWTLKHKVWDNGQMMLIDIARREGLTHGPNRKMQELMVRRNEAVLAVVQNSDTANMDGRTAAINDKYSAKITQAARLYGDDAGTEMESASQEDARNNHLTFALIAGACTVAIIVSIGVATSMMLRKRKESPVLGFQQNQQVVIGNPVQDDSQTASVTGAPVTIAAPMKSPSKTTKEAALDIS